MNKDSNRLIGDVLEINSDIVDRILNYKGPKFINIIREKYYRFRLNKIINKMRNHLILNKFNIIELVTYIETYYKSKYKSIQSISRSHNINGNETINVLVKVQPKDPGIDYIIYNIMIIDNDPNNEISYNIYNADVSVLSITIYVPDLYYKKSEPKLDAYNIIKILNTSLTDVLVSFLKEYLERYKVHGYMKEVS